MKTVLSTHIRADWDALAALTVASLAEPEAWVLWPGTPDDTVQETYDRLAREYGWTKPPGSDETAAAIEMIVVDTRSRSRLSEAAQHWLDRSERVTVLDHHEPPADRTDDLLQGSSKPAAGSATSVVLQRTQYRGLDGESSRFARTVAYMGLVADTLGFTAPSTQVQDLEAGRRLLEFGVDLAQVHRWHSASSAWRGPDGAHELQLYYRLASSLTELQVQDKRIGLCGLVSKSEPAAVGPALDRLASESPDFHALFAAIETDKRLLLVGRAGLASPAVDVGAVCRHYGGGGHASAASASLHDAGLPATLAELLEDLPAILHVQLASQPVIPQLMTRAPLLIVLPFRVSEALELLRRKGLRRAPVLLDHGSPTIVLSEPQAPSCWTHQVVGLAESVTLDRAQRHGLGEDDVSLWMEPAPQEVELEDRAACDAAVVALLSGKLAYVCAIQTSPEGGRQVVGVVTRTDAYHYFLRTRLQVSRRLASRKPRTKPHTTAVLSSAGMDRDDLLDAHTPSHMSERMAAQLSAEIRGVLADIGAVAESLHCEVYVVGGFVRDLLLGVPNDDIDVVVDGAGIAARSFADALARHWHAMDVEDALRPGTSPVEDAEDSVRHHDAFMTATVEAPCGLKIDVATARTESYEAPAALPAVELSTLRMDLFRRDFSINAMAMRLGAHVGELVDPYDGLGDLALRQCRVLHALSFVDDPTRLFRAARFSARYNLQWASHTLHLARTCVSRGFASRLSGARVYREIRKVLHEPNPNECLRILEELGVLKAVSASVYHPRTLPDLMTRIDPIVLSLEDVVSVPEIRQTARMASFCYAVEYGRVDGHATGQASRMLSHWCIAGRPRDSLLAGLKAAHQTANGGFKAWMPNPTNSALYKLLRPLSWEFAVLAVAAAELADPHSAVAVRQAWLLYVSRLHAARGELDGRDLLKLGVPKGPLVGKTLARLLDLRLDGFVHTLEDESSQVRRWISENNF